MTETIEAHSISFSYEKKSPILHNVSFSIEKKSFVAMIGPNGGGKTTLLNLLAGLEKPDTGSISLFGENPPLHPTSVGYVPQNLAVEASIPITVTEVVLGGLLSQLPLWGSFSKQHYDKAHHFLETIGLTNYCNKAFQSLSGGQKQRVLIARALIGEPSLLLLDEPTAHLDAHIEEELYSFLVDIQKEKKTTIILVSHQIQSLLSRVDLILSVHGTVETVAPKALCEHFALGLYHPPLIERSAP